MTVPEVRFAKVEDGVTGAEAGRRTCFVVGDEPGVLVRTRFVTPTEVVADPVLALTDPEREALVEEIGYWSPQVALVRVRGLEVRRDDALPVHWVALADLTVGQLTVAEEKVAAHRWIARPEDAVLSACRIGEAVVIVDGHSRAVAAHLNGVERVGVVIEEAGELQVVARGWCDAEGLVSVAQLAERQVSTAEHRRRWVDRCQGWLAEQRRA